MAFRQAAVSLKFCIGQQNHTTKNAALAAFKHLLVLLRENPAELPSIIIARFQQG